MMHFKRCRCGSAAHQRTNFAACPLNNRNIQTEHHQAVPQCRCGSLTHQRTNHSECPLNLNPNRSAYRLMARIEPFSVVNIFGLGVNRDPNSPSFGRHRLKTEKLICPNCQAKMFFEEKSSGTVANPSFSLCCSNRKFILPQLNQPPPLIKDLILRHTELGKDFIDKIRAYNSVFSFTSFCADVIFLFHCLYF